MPWSSRASDRVGLWYFLSNNPGMSEKLMVDPETLAAKIHTFSHLHAGPDMLVMANAWDAASAQHFEAAGFPAIATTSGGVAVALGYADHEQAPVEEMLASAGRMIRA